MTLDALRTNALGGSARSIAACLLIGSLAGCASPILHSTYVGEDGGVAPGLVYSLPKAQLQLVALRKQVDGEDVAAAVKAVADTTAALEAATLREAQAKTKLKDAVDVDTAADSSRAEAKAELTKRAAIAQAWLAVATSRLKATQISADAAVKKRDTLTGNLGKWIETASLTYLPSVPDAAARYIATVPEHGARDTVVKISVANGLLSSSTATATDQTATVLLNLVSASAARRTTNTMSYALNQSGTQPSAGQVAACAPFHLVRIFDPTNLTQVQEAAKDLLVKSGGVFDLVVDGVGCDMSDNACKKAAWAPERKTVDPKQRLDGYAYRAARPVSARVAPKDVSRACAPPAQALTVHAVAVVPDSSTLFVLPATAGAFVKTKVEVTFKDGMPLEFGLDMPSQLATISGLPLAIAKALIEVPASIIKLRVDYESQSLALSDARLKLLKSQLDLQKAQEAIDAEND